MVTPDTERPADGRTTAFDLVVVCLAMLLAAGLRFTGLGWGLRHVPHADEQAFVENVVQMVAHGDLDHRYYYYPGLFYYLLAPGVWLLGPQRWHGPDAYLVCRSMVAMVGVANAALAFAVGRRLLGRYAGAAVALLIAVSPISVRTAHQTRPDVLLEGLGLLALLALRSVGRQPRQDLRMGILTGIATAIKHTGLLLLPSYLVARLVRRPRGALGGAATVFLLIALIVTVTTPYSILHAREYWRGPMGHVDQYYPGTLSAASFFAHLAYFVHALIDTLGPLGAVLCTIGAVACLRRDSREWLPVLVLPISTIVVMATGRLVFPRYLLPATGAVYLFASVPIARLAARYRFAAVALLLLTLWVPLRSSASSSARLAEPTAEDRALDWLLASTPAGSRILETRAQANPGGTAGSMIGLDPRRYEVVYFSRDFGLPQLRLLTPHFDYIITGPGAGGIWGQALTTVFEGRGPGGAVGLQIRVPRDDSRPRYHAIDLSRARFASSLGAGDVPPPLGSSPSTPCSSRRLLTVEDWLEIELPAEEKVGRITFHLRADSAEPKLRVLTAQDDASLEAVLSVELRPKLDFELPPFGQVLLLEPRAVRRLRFEPRAATTKPWCLTGIELGARD